MRQKFQKNAFRHSRRKVERRTRSNVRLSLIKALNEGGQIRHKQNFFLTANKSRQALRLLFLCRSKPIIKAKEAAGVSPPPFSPFCFCVRSSPAAAPKLVCLYKLTNREKRFIIKMLPLRGIASIKACALICVCLFAVRVFARFASGCGAGMLDTRRKSSRPPITAKKIVRLFLTSFVLQRKHRPSRKNHSPKAAVFPLG